MNPKDVYAPPRFLGAPLRRVVEVLGRWQGQWGGVATGVLLECGHAREGFPLNAVGDLYVCPSCVDS